MVPRQSRRRGDSQPLTLFDVARAFSHRVPLPKLVSIKPSIRPYLSCILADAMATDGQLLVGPDDLQVQLVLRPDFLRYTLDMAGQPYQAYRTLGSQVVASQQQDPGVAELRAEILKGLADLWSGM